MTNDQTTNTTDDNLARMEPLRTADRCDRCGAQAYVRVHLGGSDLLFCGHHFTENEPKLIGISSYIHDERTHLHESEQRKPALA